MELQKLARVAAWLMLAVIVVLSLTPPAARPTTLAPHNLEHAGAFLLTGLAFSAAYVGNERWLSIGAVTFCAGIELAQLMAAGRHARISDFLVDAVAACVGVLAGPVLLRMAGRHTCSRS